MLRDESFGIWDFEINFELNFGLNLELRIWNGGGKSGSQVGFTIRNVKYSLFENEEKIP
jgi:hypothetical protein